MRCCSVAVDTVLEVEGKKITGQEKKKIRDKKLQKLQKNAKNYSG